MAATAQAHVQLDSHASQAPPGQVERADDGIDDPYQCAYCGRSTEPADKRCSHCGQSLLVIRSASVASGANLRMAVFLVGILFAVSLFEIAPPFFARLVAYGAPTDPYRFLLRVPTAGVFLGNFLTWSGAVATGLLAIAVARAILLLVCATGLSARAAPAYYLAILALVLDVLWNMVRLAYGYAGAAGAIGNILLALVALPTLFAADRDFHIVRERLLVGADPHLRGGLAYYKSGHAYRKQGMWALAVAQWRQAVGAQPREVQYYKDLGVGYAQINRFERSLRVLEEASRQSPQDAEISEIITLVRAKQAQQAVGKI